jgi:hypothetical protein
MRSLDALAFRLLYSEVCSSVASLNSLADVLRQAQPLYSECRSILNYLDDRAGIVILPSLQASASNSDGIRSQ